MKINSLLVAFCFFLTFSANAQKTTTTEEGNTKGETETTIVKDGKNDTTEENDDNSDKETKRESWKIDDTKNPFDPPKTAELKTVIQDAGIITLKNGIEVIKPVAGYQLSQLKFPKKSLNQFYLAPDTFKPLKDKKQLSEVKKTNNYIIYTWCPCKKAKEKCACKKQKVVKIMTKNNR